MRSKSKLPSHLQHAAEVIDALKNIGIDTLLYGSTGVSIYLGEFKVNFHDIDLLVPDVWIDEKWQVLQKHMKKLHYILADEHEHEFSHKSNPTVAFANESVLIRDHILTSEGEVTTASVEGYTIRTLSAQAFLRAYEFSSRDGYRINTRQKDDKTVIDLLRRYLKSY